MPKERVLDLLKTLRSDCDHIRYSCEDIGCVGGPLETAVLELLEENERLRARRDDWESAHQAQKERADYAEARIEAALAEATKAEDLARRHLRLSTRPAEIGDTVFVAAMLLATVEALKGEREVMPEKERT